MNEPCLFLLNGRFWGCLKSHATIPLLYSWGASEGCRRGPRRSIRWVSEDTRPSLKCQSYMSKGIWRQGVGSFVRKSYVSTLCPVVTCPYLCTSESDLEMAWQRLLAAASVKQCVGSRAGRSIQRDGFILWYVDVYLFYSGVTDYSESLQQ